MAASKDHALCLVNKDLTVTTKKNRALLIAARASGGKDKYQVRLPDIEREHLMGTEIGRASEAQSQRVMHLTKKGGKWEHGM